MIIEFKGRRWELVKSRHQFCEGCDLLKTQGDACDRRDRPPCTGGDGYNVLRALSVTANEGREG